ncbi:MAG: hypothetical protein LBC97_11850 [Bifidobacteriaceae bacterium]|jgi:hypothetical protein|nr:hypothetical protein [Bifidobacteriaceae bacterium]
MDGIQIELATIQAADRAFAALADDLIGAVPDPAEDTVGAFMVWTQLEAACGLAAAETLKAVPAHHLDWERIGLVLGVTASEARHRWEPEATPPDGSPGWEY